MKYIKLFMLLAVSSSKTRDSRAAVTYEFSGGRFGDTLVTYLHARWIAYKFDVPLLYKPFQYSDQLKLHEINSKYLPETIKQFKNIKRIVTVNDFKKINSTEKTLFIIPYFAESEQSKRKDNHPFEIDWTDQKFVSLARKEISPREPIELTPIPDNCISIALHVRKGGGFESNFLEHDPLAKGQSKRHYADIGAPEKFACDEFYVTQLAKILKLVDNCPVYVFIFTDDKNPEQLAQRYAQALNNPKNVTFDYRKTGNSWISNVLTDFFSMMCFDCIIRPDSHFSVIASRLGNQCATIAATMLHWHGDKLIIDEIDSTVSPLFFEKVDKIKSTFSSVS